MHFQKSRYNSNTKFSVFLIPLIAMILWIIMPKESPAQPISDITINIYGYVRNVEGIPDANVESGTLMSGVNVKTWILYGYYPTEDDYFQGTNEQTAYETKSITSHYGMYYASFDLEEKIVTWTNAGADLDDNQWLLKFKSDSNYAKITETEYLFNLFIIPLNDSDGNGIRDNFEWEFVKKFCPSFSFHNSATFCYPEAVEIIGGKYNTRIYVTFTGPWENVEFKNIEASRVQYYKKGSNWKQVIPGFGNGEFDQSFNYSNLINENPIKLTKGDSVSFPKESLNIPHGWATDTQKLQVGGDSD